MAFDRPTLTELVDRVQQDFVSRLTLAGAVLRRSLVYVLSRVLAGVAHMLYGYLDFLARQLFADLSEAEFLKRQGSLFGINPTPATYAAGNVIFSGTNTTAVPIATALSRSDGAAYTLDAEVTIVTLTAWASGTAYTAGALRRNGGRIYQCTIAGTSAGSGGPTGTDAAIIDNTVTWMYVADGTAAVSGAVTAEVAADSGNCGALVSLSLDSPIGGVDSTAIVAVGGLSGGTDEEDIEDYRVRVLERMQSPPHGGNEADYLAWTKEVAGVTRAWVFPLASGAGTVTVYFVRDDDASIIPDAGEVAAVQTHLDEMRPVTATVTAAAPTAVPMACTIDITPDNTDTRAAVTAALTDALRRDASPGGTIYRSQLLVAIGTAAGITDFTLTTPAGNVTHTAGQLATLGTITWT